MIALKPSPAPSASATGVSPHLPPSIHTRLAAATEALLKTREQVVQALDHHLQELDSLRRALGNADKPLLATLPAMTQVPVPEYRQPERPPQPVAQQPMAMPMLTQVLWPSKPDAAPPRPDSGPLTSSLVAYPAMQNAQQNVDPDLEKTTLEELNAALAYAFRHVSNARPMQPGASPANGGHTWANPGSQF